MVVLSIKSHRLLKVSKPVVEQLVAFILSTCSKLIINELNWCVGLKNPLRCALGTWFWIFLDFFVTFCIKAKSKAYQTGGKKDF